MHNLLSHATSVGMCEKDPQGCHMDLRWIWRKEIEIFKWPHFKQKIKFELKYSHWKDLNVKNYLTRSKLVSKVLLKKVIKRK
jgi:hypothetical protein